MLSKYKITQETLIDIYGNQTQIFKIKERFLFFFYKDYKSEFISYIKEGSKLDIDTLNVRNWAFVRKDSLYFKTETLAKRFLETTKTPSPIVYWFDAEIQKLTHINLDRELFINRSITKTHTDPYDNNTILYPCYDSFDEALSMSVNF